MSWKTGTLLAALCLQISNSEYTSKLLKVSRCRGPVPPYAKGQRLVEEYISIVHKDNKALLSGNITYHDPCRQCKLSISVMRESKRLKRPIIYFKDMTCKHVFVQVLNAVFGVNVDYKTCARPLETYVFKEVDIDKAMKSIRLPFRNSGVYYYNVLLFTPEWTQVCYDLKVLITFANAEKPEKTEIKYDAIQQASNVEKVTIM